MAQHPKKARSLYRQLRLTCTLQTNGVASYSIYAKGLNDEWKQQHCLIRDTALVGFDLNSTEDVIHALWSVLGENFLPHHMED